MAATRLSSVDLSTGRGGNVGELPFPNCLQVDFSDKYQVASSSRTSRHTKRERSQNWGQVEKCALVQLIQKRLAVIEDKAGDTDAIRRRVQAWREIHSEFSAKMGGNQRDVQRMREQWRRIKHWAKQEMKYFRETEELDGNSGLKQPNELAHYICEMIRNFERNEFRNDEDFQLVLGDVQDAELQQSPLAPLPEALDSYQEQSNNEATDGSVVVLDAIPVKQEPDGVDLLDGESECVTVIKAPSMQPNYGSSPPTQPMHNPGRKKDHTASRKPTPLPSWTKDFPEIVGAEPAAQGANIDDEDDDDESDFLDDSDDDDFGSFSDWGRDNPVNGSRPYDRLPPTAPRKDQGLDNGPTAKFEKLRLTFARREFKRRMQMMEAEHSRRMQIFELQRETAQLKKKLAFRQLKQRRAPRAPTTSSNSYGRLLGHVHR